MTWFLDFRVDDKGGGLMTAPGVYYQDVLLDPVGMADFHEAIRGCGIVFATHGFNVTRAEGRAALAGWEALQTLPPGVVYIGVLWPGDSAWIPGIDYPIEGNEATATGDALARFIHAEMPEAASVSFVSHSLGARVVLQAIRGLAPAVPVPCLMLMAGAIDDSCLTGEYAREAARVGRISVLASVHDEVLALAFPLGNLLGGIVSRGSPYWNAALGRDGPASNPGGLVVSGWQIPPGWDYGHHDYLPPAPPPAIAAPALPLPQAVPPADTPEPVPCLFGWQQAWSAAVHATRYAQAAMV